MFGWKKKTVQVMNGKSFIAAYSEIPFTEAQNEKTYPDYTFHKVDGMHWCVRLGDIAVPWGFGAEVNGYAANGTIILSRKNVTAVTFDGRGFPYVKEGDAFYLYESELGETGFFGFSIYMRDRLLVILKKIAKNISREMFEEKFNAEDAVKKLSENKEMKELLEEHKLTLKRVTIHATNEKK